MSVEHHQEHAERHEAKSELEEARREKLEELRQNNDQEKDTSDKRAEAAREIIHKEEKAPEPVAAPEASSAQPLRHPLLNPKLNYADTMRSVQQRLKPASRAFSRVIHTPAVEKASEMLEKTVARPSITAGATWTALIVGSIFYFTARHYGYMLSGSEMLFSFVVGALIGLVLEGFWMRLKPHR